MQTSTLQKTFPAASITRTAALALMEAAEIALKALGFEVQS